MSNCRLLGLVPGIFTNHCLFPGWKCFQGAPHKCHNVRCLTCRPFHHPPCNKQCHKQYCKDFCQKKTVLRSLKQKNSRSWSASSNNVVVHQGCPLAATTINYLRHQESLLPSSKFPPPRLKVPSSPAQSSHLPAKRTPTSPTKTSPLAKRSGILLGTISSIQFSLPFRRCY